jgi:predicted LPLAT superfamily acyltransferase
MNNSNWKTKKERSTPFALRTICWLALNISRGFARLWLYPITLYFFLTSSKVRRASKNYLKRVKPPGGHNLTQTLKHIYYFSSIILDRVYFITGRTSQFDIKIFNENLVAELVKNNSGFILLGSHTGGFDILQYLTPKYGQAKIMMDVSHNSMITDILYNLNPVMFDAIIDANGENTLLKIKESLDESKFVAILADRSSDNQKLIECSLLGSKVNISKFPFSLAHILKKPVIIFFGLYMGGNKYEIHFKELRSNFEGGRSTRENNIAEDAQAYMDNIQNMLKKHPFNWFNFYDYWDEE